MKLEWMMFANYAEDNSGLLYLVGGGWDTINVHAPLEGGPENTVALMQGYLVIRLLFHHTETGRDHSFTLTLADEDGQQVHQLGESFRVDKTPGLPPTWDQGFNIIAGLAGMPLPKFGVYEFSILIDGQHLGDRPFRVLKLY